MYKISLADIGKSVETFSLIIKELSILKYGSTSRQKLAEFMSFSELDSACERCSPQRKRTLFYNPNWNY